MVLKKSHQEKVVIEVEQYTLFQSHALPLGQLSDIG
jgi:hypothetical protein